MQVHWLAAVLFISVRQYAPIAERLSVCIVYMFMS